MHSDFGATQGRCLHNWVVKHYPELAKIKAYRTGDMGLLYRLDFETAGVVLYGKNSQTISQFFTAQQAGLLQKHYLAVTAVRPNIQTPAAITTYFRSFGSKGQEVRVVPVKKAHDTTHKAHKTQTHTPYTTKLISSTKQLKSTDTRLSQQKGNSKLQQPTQSNQDTEALAVWQNNLTITKGFRHQIRAHLAYYGTPIIGDPLYTRYKAEDMSGNRSQLSKSAMHPPTAKASSPTYLKTSPLELYCLGVETR